jgi:hypothetical protein
VRTLDTRRGTYELEHFDLWNRRDHDPNAHKLLGPGARVVVMGSCFARDAVGYLRARGYRARRYPAGHLYNPHVIRLELEQVLGGGKWPSDVVLDAGDGVSHRYRKLTAANRDQLVERDREATEQARKLLGDADLVLIVFGTTAEVWRDSDAGLPTNEIPPPESHRQGGWQVDEGELGAIRDDLARTQSLLSEGVTAAQVYAVCPIPLYATWLDRHIVDANGRSKALLRAALDLELGPEATYLPLWDWMQAQTGRWSPTQRDGRHLDRTGVNRIMLFAERFLATEPVAALPWSVRARARAADALDRIRRR